MIEHMRSFRCIECGRKFTVHEPHKISGALYCPEGHVLEQYRRNMSEEFGSITDLREEFGKYYKLWEKARVQNAHLRGALTALKNKRMRDRQPG